MDYVLLQLERHPELAMCPKQLQLASPQPDVSATAGNASSQAEVPAPAGPAPVSAGGSGESLQPPVSAGSSGEPLQLSAVSTPPSVSAGGSGEPLQPSTVFTLPHVSSGGSGESIRKPPVQPPAQPSKAAMPPQAELSATTMLLSGSAASLPEVSAPSGPS